MGAGIKVSRALSALALPLLAASCIDFVAPDLPELGAPAVFEATLRVREDGYVQIEAELMPGLDEAGLRRSVARQQVHVLGRAISPAAGGPAGRHSYFAQWQTTPDTVAGPLTIEAPVVAGVGLQPALRWPGIRKADRDTIALSPGADLVVRPRTPAEEAPAPLHRSWLLQLEGFESSFVIGANGAPPDSLVIESHWLPEPLAGLINAQLSYTRSVSVRPEDANYIGVLLVESRIVWTIVVTAAEPAFAARIAGGRE